MNKEDYMKLSKERLAELLAERDLERPQRDNTYPPLVIPMTYEPPCYAPNGICTNPQHDCINCPKLWGGGYNGYWYTTTTTTKLSEQGTSEKD